MKNFSIAIFLSFLLSVISALAFADSSLANKFSDSELMQILKQDGYGAVTILKDGAITIKIEGKTLILFNKEDGDLQLVYGKGAWFYSIH